MRANRFGAQFRSETGQTVQYRDLSQTAGLGLEFDSPTWVLDKFVTTVLAAAPLLACSDRVPLPPKSGFEVLIPRFDTTAVAAPAPALQNTGLPADNTVTDSLSSFVTMIPSQTVVSYQALGLGNVDAFITTQASAVDHGRDRSGPVVGPRRGFRRARRCAERRDRAGCDARPDAHTGGARRRGRWR